MAAFSQKFPFTNSITTNTLNPDLGSLCKDLSSINPSAVGIRWRHRALYAKAPNFNRNRPARLFDKAEQSSVRFGWAGGEWVERMQISITVAHFSNCPSVLVPAYSTERWTTDEVCFVWAFFSFFSFGLKAFFCECPSTQLCRGWVQHRTSVALFEVRFLHNTTHHCNVSRSSRKCGNSCKK